MSADERSREALLRQQERREQLEREHAEQATTGAEERAAGRRADKAAYLQEKLGEQAEHPDADEG